MVRAAGWQPGNVDCTVVAEAPKVAPRRAEIEDRLSRPSARRSPSRRSGPRVSAQSAGARASRCFAVAIVTNGAP